MDLTVDSAAAANSPAARDDHESGGQVAGSAMTGDSIATPTRASEIGSRYRISRIPESVRERLLVLLLVAGCVLTLGWICFLAWLPFRALGLW